MTNAISDCQKIWITTTKTFILDVKVIMPIANIMKIRKMFYFYISMDSGVKIGCFLNNIVVIAQKTLVLSQNGV